MAESVRARLRRTVNRVLHRCGLHLVRRASAFEVDDLLRHAASRNQAIETWIDVGASDGQWSLRAHRYFPSSQFLLFEPLAERKAALEHLRLCRGFGYVAAAAGALPGTIEFAIDPQLDGSGVAAPGTTRNRKVAVETIDRVVEERGLSGPFGVKLDTHGHELAVLKGATHVLDSTELLIIEAYNFQLTPDCLRFHELCAWLEIRGFRCCDLADPMRRPHDGILWQMDLAFARSTNPVFASNHYEE